MTEPRVEEPILRVPGILVQRRGKLSAPSQVRFDRLRALLERIQRNTDAPRSMSFAASPSGPTVSLPIVDDHPEIELDPPLSARTAKALLARDDEADAAPESGKFARVEHEIELPDDDGPPLELEEIGPADEQVLAEIELDADAGAIDDLEPAIEVASPLALYGAERDAFVDGLHTPSEPADADPPASGRERVADPYESARHVVASPLRRSSFDVPDLEPHPSVRAPSISADLAPRPSQRPRPSAVPMPIDDPTLPTIVAAQRIASTPPPSRASIPPRPSLVPQPFRPTAPDDRDVAIFVGAPTGPAPIRFGVLLDATLEL